jgi:hypothetical protein
LKRRKVRAASLLFDCQSNSYIDTRGRGDVSVYSQSDSNGIYAYEVFQVQKLAERHINGRILEAMEVTPSDEQFGKKGNTYWHLADAMQKMAEMCERRETWHYKRLSRMKRKIA